MYNKDNTREADEIFSRILSEMERQGKKYAELNENLGLPQGTFSAWKAGRSRNYCERIGAIANYLNVDVKWLVTGELSEGAINREEQELLGMFRRLDEEKQKAVLQNMKWLAE